MAIGLANKAKLGIPRINQNPRPPGQHFKTALSNRIRAPRIGLGNARPASYHHGLSPLKPVATPSNPTPATTTAQPTNAAQPATQSAPKDPLREAAESAQTQTFQIPSYTPEAGKTDPRDATYWESVSKLIAKDNNEYAGDLREQSLADAGYGQARREALQNKLVGERQLGEKLLGTGLVASGFHDRAEAEANREFTNSEAKARNTKEVEDQAREAARQALREGFGVDAAALLAEAVGRRGEGEENEAEKGPGEPTAANNAPGGGGKTQQGGGSHKGKGKSKQGVGGATSLGHAHVPTAAFVHGAAINPHKTALAQRRKAKK